MARPLSHPVQSVSYDPYSYYQASSGHSDRFIHICAATRPASSYHSRPASIWSTSSICSDDSSLDLALDDRAHDFDDEDDDPLLVTPISPAESNSSRISWSSMASSSSSSSTSRSNGKMLDHSERFRRSMSGKPRGPRPLPALPISQPSSPYSLPSSLPSTLPLKVTPPLRLNLKDLTPPPSYEEAMSAGVQSPSPALSPESEPAQQMTTRPRPFPFDAETEVTESPAEFMTSPAEDTIIDWERIEDFIVRCDG